VAFDIHPGNFGFDTHCKVAEAMKWNTQEGGMVSRWK
jgi:hypothetical protein